MIKDSKIVRSQGHVTTKIKKMLTAMLKQVTLEGLGWAGFRQVGKKITPDFSGVYIFMEMRGIEPLTF
jgi:hypothetical protein